MTPVTQHTPQPPTLADTMTALYTRYHAVIRAYILVRVHNPDLADDLTQDVFLNAWRTLATYTGAASHATWLFRIAKNAVIDSGRAHLRHVHNAPMQPLDALLALHLDPADPHTSNDPERMALLSEAVAEARAIAQRLPAQQQLAFALSVAGLPLHGATSKMTASRARKRFLELHRQRQAWRGEETGEATA